MLRTFNRALALTLIVVSLSMVAFTQDDKENLGPKDDQKSVAINPITQLMQTVTWQLKSELRGQHPRVFVTATEIETLRQRAHSTHREMWQATLQNLHALKVHPPDAKAADERRAQNTVAIAIAEVALAYAVERDPKYLAAAKEFMDAATNYEIWGYTYNKPNVDLAAGHLLYAMGWAYDLLYHDLSDAERAKYRNKIVKQGELLYNYYKPKPGRTYSYSQNHLFIPMAGLGVAAYALQGEAPEAENWARLSRSLYDRVLTTYSPDGYYYEGFEYWIFSTPWIIHYLDAHAHSTGEDLYDRAPGLRSSHLYVAHAQLPGGHNAFDFGDMFFGPLTRTGKDEELNRTHPDGHFITNYNLLYRLAQRFKSPEIQGVAAWQKSMGQLSSENFWSLIWYEPSISAQPIEKLTPWHYFKDHEVAYWRTDWSANATAIAFKCGPPEGHHTAELSQKFPDWHLEAGHAHPDANSYIIYAHGQYLTGDSGYSGVPTTEQHNTLLLDNRGQGSEGEGHDAWRGFPYGQLNKVRIVEFKPAKDSVSFVGDAASAYASALGLTRFRRTLTFKHSTGFTVSDEIASSEPHTFTSLIHADNRLTTSGSNFGVETGGVKLIGNVISPNLAKLEVEPNWMTAPGRPGSVASGKREARGERLRVSNPAPSKSTQFILNMKLETK